jgi:hypothetical protein
VFLTDDHERCATLSAAALARSAAAVAVEAASFPLVTEVLARVTASERDLSRSRAEVCDREMEYMMARRWRRCSWRKRGGPVPCGGLTVIPTW